MTPRTPLATALVAIAAGLAGCGGDDADPAPAVAAKPTQLEAVAPPQADAVPDAGRNALLAVDGRIGTTNAGHKLRVGERTLKSLGLTRIDLYEPFAKREMTFQAVPMRNVLDLVRPEGGAKTLHSIALNDYVVDLPVDVAAADGVYLALREGDGKKIPVEEGGPIRVVFTEGAKGADVDNYWIWSLATIDVR